MKTSAEIIVKAGVDLTQRLFSRVIRALCIPASATITPQLAPLSRKSRAKPAALLMAGAMLTLVSTALLTPRTAEARSGYLDAVILLPYPDSAQAYQCGNCHTNWNGNGPAYSSRIDYYIYNGLAGPGAIATTSPTYAMDSDQDGRTNMEEIQASRLAGFARPAQFATGVSTGPNVANNWNWQIPDRDGDGCSHYLSRFNEEGTYLSTSGVATAAIVGTGTTYNNYKRFNPRGWDMDDNDAAQGCNPTPWTNTVIDVTSGTSTDNLPPGAVNTLSGAAIGSAIIPLKWNAVGDDGNGVPGGTAGGAAHSYELRYTTSAFANGTVGRNPRSPADWEIMHNIAEPDEIDTGLWSAAGDPDSLMQALYEPRPDVPGALQPCNARNGAGTMTCTAGASYDIKARGTVWPVNTIVNGTTYWVALWVHDGVTRLGAGGTLTTPVSVTEQATLSNIIAVTAGTAGTTTTSGAAISSISPTTLSGTASIAVTATGFGLNSTQAAQMVMTNTAGTVIASATGLTYTGTTVAGSFASPIADGIYNLELRTTGAVTKAAWVNAMTVNSVGDPPPPTVTSVTPNSRGQGAQNQCIQISGTNFYAPLTVSFGAGITVNSVIINSTTSVTACISIAPTATTGTRNIWVTANGQSSNTVPFTVTAAPVIGSPPPNGTYGVAYSYTCTATGGVPPYTWSMTGLPPDLIFNADNCQVTGTPTLAGTFVGSLTVTDSNAGRSSIGTSITISATVPGAPTIGPATGGNDQATVTFTAPASNGGAAITSYTATSSPGGITGSCAASPCTVTGLTNGTAYTFTVTATNALGNSPASAASNSVTPGATASDVDLVMTVVSTTSTSVGTGHSFVINNTEKNQGTTNMTAADNTVMFYLSTDPMITTSDSVLTGSRVVPALAAGVSSSAVTTVTVPTSVVPGTYYVGACADATYLQMETNETNNCSAGTTITVIRNVDLVMTAVSTTTTSVGTGTFFVIDNTEKNIGTTNMTAADNTVTFYLSTDNIITTADIELVGSRVVTALAAGASSTASTSVMARSAVSPGTYYIGACADVANAQVESNEVNNCRASAATITIVGSITVPGAPTIGTATAGNVSASVNFTAPINNGGSAITSYTATSNPGGITGTCTVSPCTVTGLTNGTAYTFTVTATNAVGTGAASAASNSVILLENVPPSVPTKLTATAFSTTQINLTWRASTDNVGVTGYRVYRNGVQVGAPSGTSYSDTGLTAATSYQYTVAACDAAGNCSAQSAAVTGTTKRK